MAKTQKGELKSLEGIFNGTKEEQQTETKIGRPTENRETKVRKNFTILPSVFENVRKIAHVDRTSISEIIETLLTEYIEKNKEKLIEYEKIKK